MIRITLSAAAAAALLAGAAAAPEARAQDAPDQVVFVKGRGEGRGMTRLRDGECFVVTPDHVVRGSGMDFDEDDPEVLYVTDSGDRSIDASLLKAVHLSDLAILRIDTSDARTATLCAPWPPLEDIPAALDTVRQARLEGRVEGRTQDGGREVMEVEVTHVYAETFIIRPRTEGRSIQTGMSGSLVYVNGVPAGILRDRVGDGPDGTVYRLDYLEGVLGVTLRSLARPAPPPPGLVIVGSLLMPGGGQAFTQRLGKGAMWAGGTIALAAIARGYYQPVTRDTIHPQQFGPPRTYSYRAKEYPLRDYWPVIWLASGVWSVLDARKYVRDEYGDPAPPAAGAAPTVSVRVVPRPMVLGGEPALGLTLELSF